MIPECPILHTERLEITLVSQGALDELYASNSPETICEFLGYYNAEIYEQQTARYRKGFSTHRSTILIGKMRLHGSPLVIGNCALHNWYPEHKRAEMGYDISNPQYLRQGYMSEASLALVQYAFDVLDMHRLEALTSPDNIASIKVLEKLGFVREGLKREHYFHGGIYHDSVVWGLLKSEWPTQP